MSTGATQIGALLALFSRIGIRHGMTCVSLLRQFQRRWVLPMIVVNEIGSDSKEVISAMRFTFVCHASPKEAIVRFLQQIVGKVAIAGAAPEICPYWP